MRLPVILSSLFAKAALIFIHTGVVIMIQEDILLLVFYRIFLVYCGG